MFNLNSPVKLMRRFWTVRGSQTTQTETQAVMGRTHEHQSYLLGNTQPCCQSSFLPYKYETTLISQFALYGLKTGVPQQAWLWGSEAVTKLNWVWCKRASTIHVSRHQLCWLSQASTFSFPIKNLIYLFVVSFPSTDSSIAFKMYCDFSNGTTCQMNSCSRSGDGWELVTQVNGGPSSDHSSLPNGNGDRGKLAKFPDSEFIKRKLFDDMKTFRMFQSISP